MSGSAEFDQFTDRYDDDLNQALAASGEGKEFFARGRVEWLAECLARLNHQSRSVLDYGCGIGDTTVLLAETSRVPVAGGTGCLGTLPRESPQRTQFACQLLSDLRAVHA